MEHDEQELLPAVASHPSCAESDLLLIELTAALLVLERALGLATPAFERRYSSAAQRLDAIAIEIETVAAKLARAVARRRAELS